jgi:hypothetical protein
LVQVGGLLFRITAPVVSGRKGASRYELQAQSEEAMHSNLLRVIALRMKGSRMPLTGLSLLGIGLAAIMSIGPLSALGGGGGTTVLAKLWIDDSAHVLSDGLGSVEDPSLYSDFRLPGGDTCVTAFVNSTGLFFINMDNNGQFGNDCNSNAGVPNPRTFVLKFPDSSGACGALGLTPDGSGLCTLTGHDDTRIRAEKLFANNNRQHTTPVAFLFRKDGTSYEVRSDTEVPFSSSGNMRTLTYSGTTRLWKISSTPQRPAPVSSSFAFPFQMRVEQVPQ